MTDYTAEAYFTIEAASEKEAQEILEYAKNHIDILLSSAMPALRMLHGEDADVRLCLEDNHGSVEEA